MADFKYSQRIHDMQKTADIVQGLFGSMTDPEIISFGGGAPAKEALPIDQIREIANDVLTVNGRGVEALQYGKPLGAQDLREIVAKDLLAPKGVNVSPDNILITAGGLESMVIPDNDCVRLLSQFVEEMDLTDLYATYSRIRGNQADPRQMLKIVLYAYLDGHYSSREMEKACQL